MGKTASLANIGTIADSSLGFRNRIINGAMVIDQRNAGASVTTNSGYTTDRWQTYSSAGTRSFQQVSDAPTGFKNSLKVTTTSASAGATSLVQQWFEGYNVADFNLGTANAVTFTLTFWVKSSVTGTFAGDFANAVTGTPNRSYVFTYTINAANTWEQKTVTVTGDTSGTWATDNTAGLRVLFNLGTGGTAGTAGSWQAGDLIRTSASVGIEGTLNATWQVTGVQLEKGSTATSFDYRPYGTELALCQRYYEKSFNQATAPAQSAGSTGAFRFVQVKDANVRQISCGTAFFKASKRATPTVTLFNPEAANALPRNLQRALDWTTGGLGTVAASESVLVFNDWTTATSGGLGDDFTVQWTASAEL
jgi:hypothetical protein